MISPLCAYCKHHLDVVGNKVVCVNIICIQFGKTVYEIIQRS